MIYNHHLVRALYYKEKPSKNPEVSKEIGKKIVTVMEFSGGEKQLPRSQQKETIGGIPERTSLTAHAKNLSLPSNRIVKKVY